MTLRVLALTPYPPRGAPSRYRVYQMMPALDRLGIEIVPRPFYDDPAFDRLHRSGGLAGKVADLVRCAHRRRRALRSSGDFDTVLVHRELGPLAGSGPLAALEESQRHWVFDFDDAVHIPNVSRANRAFGRFKSHATAALLARSATRVSAGNRWLANWAREARPGGSPEDVRVVPTAVDAHAWSPRARFGRTRRLVWIGSPTTVGYLELVRPALERVARRFSDLELHCVGASFEVPGLRCVVHPWSEATEIEQVAACDIGLAPLPRSDWANGKCGLKLLLYLALGLPAVASDAGVHRDMIRHGENGWLAADGEAFAAGLEALLDDPGLAARFGAAGRATVLETYSIEAVAPKLAGVLTSAAEAS